MVRSAATIAFIGLAAAAGIYVGTRKTVIKGDVMAANMLEAVKEKGITKIVCDDTIPVGLSGAVFQCKFTGNDGSTARFEYTMNRAGQLAAQLLNQTGPALEQP